MVLRAEKDCGRFSFILRTIIGLSITIFTGGRKDYGSIKIEQSIKQKTMHTKPAHTGKKRRIRPLHRRIALHASSLLLLLGGGFIPSPFNFTAQTYSYDVTARVPAPLPSSPAVITSPTDQQHVTDQTITVSGSCPADSYVKVFVNGTEAGVATCSGGAFSLPVTLAPGANTLTAKVYNVTDDEGPSSGAITVYYDAPVVPSQSPGASPSTSTGSPTGTSGNAGPPAPTITLPYHFAIQYPGDKWQWEVTIGGKAPFDIVIDWGDGNTQRFTRAEAGTFTISHVYNKASTYQPVIQVTDKNGSASYQWVVEVRNKANLAAQFGGNLFSGLDPWVAWPLYTAILGGVGIFWGYELHALHRHIKHRRHARANT